MKATFKDGSFSTFPEHYSKKAMEYEKTGDLYRSLQSWEIVRKFQTGDKEVEKKIENLKVKLNTLAEEHFNKGVAYYKNNDVRASRNEFLLALQYNPEHKKALEYLKDRLAGEDFIMYEVKKDDTLKEIAGKIYDDPQKDFLIAYFNDMEKDAKLMPETMLRLPVLESIPKKPNSTGLKLKTPKY
jgi:tetratricopeptide (TPR) repeat protein